MNAGFTPLVTCPACRTPTLRPGEAAPILPSRRCASCGGQFVRGEHYYRWLEHPDRAVHPAASRASEPVDTPRAKVCPECGKLMRRYRVGHGLTFCVDRCGACAGIWLDAGEWEALERHGVHDRLHLAFSDAWRARALHEELERIARLRVEARVGRSDFAELRRVADWIERHPHRDEAAAYLLTRLRALPPAHQHGDPTAIERFNRSARRCASPSARPRGFVRGLLAAWRSSARARAGTPRPAG